MREGDVVGADGIEVRVLLVLPSGLFVGTDRVTYSPRGVSVLRAGDDAEHEATLREAMDVDSLEPSLARTRLVDLLSSQERHLEALRLAFPALTWDESEGTCAMFHGGPVRVIRWRYDGRWEAMWSTVHGVRIGSMGDTPVGAVAELRRQIGEMESWAQNFLKSGG